MFIRLLACLLLCLSSLTIASEDQGHTEKEQTENTTQTQAEPQNEGE